MDDQREARFHEAIRVVSSRIGQRLRALSGEMKGQAQEIRLRVNRPVVICCAGGLYFLQKDGRLHTRPGEGSLTANSEDLAETFQKACGDSIYSHEQEIRSGFVTISGGHRVGLAGTAVLQDGRLKGLRDISSVNLRIARQVKGCASPLLRELRDGIKGGLLLAGPPSSGKTTLLRDLARQLSSGFCGPIRRVAVVDERGELASVCLGTPQNDLGLCCDVLDGYPKGEGILQAVRTLSPEFVLCDELGGERDTAAVEEGLNAGVTLISSIHAGSVGELIRRPQARRLLRTGAFGSVALLEGRGKPGTVTGIYKAGELLVEMDRVDSDHRGGDAGGVYGVA